MSCGCKKKNQPVPPQVKITVTETKPQQVEVKLNETQQQQVEKIVDRINQINQNP